MRCLFGAGVLVLAMLPNLPAYSSTLELGVGATLERDESEGLTANLAYIDEWQSWPIEFSAGFIEGSSDQGATEGKDIGYIGLGARYYWKGFFVGLGGVLVSDTNDRVSSAFNFKSQLGFQYESIVIKFEHISNAGLSGKNLGENILTLGYSFSFD